MPTLKPVKAYKCFDRFFYLPKSPDTIKLNYSWCNFKFESGIEICFEMFYKLNLIRESSKISVNFIVAKFDKKEKFNGKQFYWVRNISK